MLKRFFFFNYKLHFNLSKPEQFLDTENEARQMYVLEISLLFIHTYTEGS